jgi:inosine-uridine nucleoside N-ribohydrolase
MPDYPLLTNTRLTELLSLPEGHADVVMDTDTYNEIDDQFAVVYALFSPHLNVKALYAAPFFNDRSDGPADGMERSYQEILRILERLGRDAKGMVFRGSPSYLPAKGTPVRSAAAEDLIAKAMAQQGKPLYVLTIGAITNVASAILLEPRIADKIVIVWLGGHPTYWEHTREFNLMQDVPAAQVVFDSGVPLVQIPCINVAEHLRTTLPEVERYVQGQGAIGDYLYETYLACRDDHFAYSRVIWDISTVAYMNHPEWVPTRLEPAPVLRDDTTWGPTDETRHPVRMAYHMNRDAIFGDLFRKLAAHA